MKTKYEFSNDADIEKGANVLVHYLRVSKGEQTIKLPWVIVNKGDANE